MSVAENKAILERFWGEIFNEGDVAVVDELVATEYLNHDLVPGETPGSEGLKGFVLYLRNAFPDIHFDIEQMVAEDDLVVSRWQSTATHRGEFMGIPPTGISAGLNGMAIHRVENGKIVEAWNNWDALGLLTALGAIPQSGDGE
ncbi:MAG: ester cyclase [Caldilineaceae bacterium]|jgi:steroid delta-isomerase-like uncharacterized protein